MHVSGGVVIANKLVFSHSGNFVAKFGAPAKQTLEARLIQLTAFDAKRGIGTRSVFVDDPASVGPFGVPPATAANPLAIKAVIDAISRKSGIDYYLIVGGHDIVPLFEYPNPISGTSDKVVPSDNGYASSSTTADPPFVPDRRLGRLPTGNDPTPDILWKQFDEILLFKPMAPSALSGYAIYADAWTQPSQNIAKQLGIAPAQHSVSPPLDVQANPTSFPAAGLSAAKMHYVNLHGELRVPHWVGQDGVNSRWYPDACLPALIPSGVRHSVAACEACYGADSFGTNLVRRTVSTANCLTYMDLQAIGFCGSTTIAYGGTNDAPDLWAADLLVLYFLQAVQAAKDMGAALLDAKVKVAQDAMRRNNAYDDLTKKTLLQFVLYGDPSISPLASQATPKVAKSTEISDSLRELIPNLNAALPSVSRIELPVIQPVPGSKQATVGLPPLPGKLASTPVRLLYREQQELSWKLPAGLGAMSYLREKSIVEGDVFKQPVTTLWTVETYEIGMIRQETEQYYVRVLESRGLEFRMVAQGISR